VFAAVLAAVAISFAGAASLRAQEDVPAQDSSSQDVSSLKSRFGATDVNAVAQQLGFTPEEVSQFRSQEAAGGLTPDQFEKACAALGSKHLPPDQIDNVASGLGLSPDETAQLKTCAEPGPGLGQLPGGANLQEPQLQYGTEGKGAMGRGPAGAELKGPQAGLIPQPEAPSAIERSFRGLDPAIEETRRPAPMNLKQFGYSIFSRPVSTFAPVTNVPVASEYVIGPGDELRVLFWGRVNRNLSLNVERDGSVLVPEIGPVQVGGLTFAQAKRLIEGRAGQITGVQVAVTMGTLRTIQVFVVGEVAQPGAYTVSALSRITNALAGAGGITKVGSLRDIQLRRGNQLIRTLDLYDVLLRGNTAADERLEPQDVIFVPVIGPVVALAGDVKRPAIYELARNNQNLGGVLQLGGGISAFGYSQRLQVERIDAHERRVALDINLEQVQRNQFAIRDGDLIKVYPVLPEQKDVVDLKGNVYRPGTYQWYAGMRVADLVGSGEGVKRRTFFGYALITRENGPARKLQYVPVDLQAALTDHQGPADVVLSPKDTLTIYSETEVRDSPTVAISGEVRKPGTYPWDLGMKVSDLIYLAGGVKDDAYEEQAELARTEVIDGAKTRRTYMDVNLRSALRGEQLTNLALKRNDQLFIRAVPDWHLPWTVQVKGRVLRPGTGRAPASKQRPPCG
jgi:protein involved in polysaccharide export with SLBB domain